jgi:hypothetical protein
MKRVESRLFFGHYTRPKCNTVHFGLDLEPNISNNPFWGSC